MHRSSIKAVSINRFKSWPAGLLLLILLLIVIAAPLGGQTRGPIDQEVSALPATTGAPLTIVPVDRPDIDCSIQEWNATGPKPYLKLLCPPEAVYAPVRVYLKLSWMKAEDVVKDIDRIIARRKQLTRIRSNQNVVMVRMEVSQGKDHPQVKWVDFNGVMDVALITDARGR
jgi:hypothetical protein